MAEKGQFELKVRVVPNASREEIIGWQDDCLKIKLTAIPEDGKANRALISYLAKLCGCSKRDIKLVRGEKSRIKVIEMPESGNQLNWVPTKAED